MRRSPHVMKLSGAGNDFILIEAAEMASIPGEMATWIERVCKRGVSIGADGVIVVDPSGEDRVRVTFYNPDGSSAFCGNGSRCAARFARLRGLAGESMVLETDDFDIPARVFADGSVRLELPPPRDTGPREVVIGDSSTEGRWIQAGAPHFVVRVEDVSKVPFGDLAPRVRHAEVFGPLGTNFDIVSSAGPAAIRMRTWERGVEGETLACGSGAVASAFACRLTGGPDRLTVISSSGIPLRVELPGDAAAPSAALLTGEARVVFEGQVHPEAATPGPG